MYIEELDNNDDEITASNRKAWVTVYVQMLQEVDGNLKPRLLLWSRGNILFFLNLCNILSTLPFSLAPFYSKQTFLEEEFEDTKG
jgi:hypothetical protein